MAGQNLTPDQIAAAAAVQQGAASQQQAAQNLPAAAQQQAAPGNPAQPPAQNPPAAEFILTQDQFNQRWGEKMAALEKEIGLPIKDVKAALEKTKKPPAPTGEPLSGADLKIAKMEALMTEGVPSKQIPLLLQHLNIAGKTREEIQASVRQLIELKLLTIETQQLPAQQPGNNLQPPAQAPPAAAAQGAGQPGVPAAPGKKIWKTSEIAKMTSADHIKNKDEILQAMQEGRLIEG
jgi:DNA-binding transcriptional MerR regulator